MDRFNLKPMSKDAVPAALAKAERYRLLNEPGEAESICLDILQVDAHNEDALVIQGQTHMNVVGISTENGKLLWQKEKITSNPNAIYLDEKIIVGVGANGRNVALDPVSGAQVEDLGFTKRACTRRIFASVQLGPRSAIPR